MYESYTLVKRKEIEMFSGSDANEVAGAIMTHADATLSNALAGAIDTPLIDHHCHGVSPAVRLHPFPGAVLRVIARRHPARPSSRNRSVSRSVASAPVLDLEPSCPAEAYVEPPGARRRLVNRRFLRGSGLESLLVDTGLRNGAEILDVEDVAAESAEAVHRARWCASKRWPRSRAVISRSLLRGISRRLSPIA